MDLAFEKRWRELVTRLSARFDAGTLDLNALLFLIGVVVLQSFELSYYSAPLSLWP